MNREVGWHFPPTNGGINTGINDPGMAHFSGEPMDSLAREVIQNSLDAQDNQDVSVHVSFELRQLEIDVVGRDELSKSIERCVKEFGNDESSKELNVLTDAKQCISGNRIPCLSISDRNTTGLRGDHWRVLVKSQGRSYKPNIKGAGGSHGIGKYAPFAVSRLRTVFYWSCFENGDVLIEKLQGKSVLVSHHDESGDETQAIGFYGIKKGCLELSDSIPKEFGIYDNEGSPIKGTKVTVLGFRETDHWRINIARSILTSYFYAISTRRLKVLVEPDESADFFEIGADSIERCFDKLLKSCVHETVDSEPNSLKESFEFWKLTQENLTTETQDPDLGHCKLWIKVEEGLPRKVALIRSTGMLITSSQKGLERFPRFQDFAAVCVFEDEAGNELLRQMENPTHDQFQPNRLDPESVDSGTKILKRITRWIRDEIRKYAGSPLGSEKGLLPELAAYLPDYFPEESFDTSGNNSEDVDREKGFGEKVVVSLKPVKKSKPETLPEDESESDIDDNTGGSRSGSGTDNGEGGGTGHGKGTGSGTGGLGSKGRRPTNDALHISDIRILPVLGQGFRYLLSFKANDSGLARIEIEEAGDSYATPIKGIRTTFEGEAIEKIMLTSGKRMKIEIEAESSLERTALRVVALRQISEKST